MASWLTSKLKAAEQILNQIDQHAAESLGSQEKAGDEEHLEAILPISSSDASLFPEQHPPSTHQSSLRAPARSGISLVSVSSSEHKEIDWTQMLASEEERLISKVPKPFPERKPNPKRVRALRKKATSNKISVEKQGEKFVSVDLGPSEAHNLNEPPQEPSQPGEAEVKQTEEELQVYQATISEREAFVEKLENEKEALERLVAEREEQQKKEAADLKTSMAELIQAADLEKQRHTHTRIEALAKETTLQNESVELAKKLAAAQRILDTELTKLVEFRTKVEIKRVSVGELERNLSRIRNPPSVLSKGPYVSTFNEDKQRLLYDIDHYKSQLKDIQEELVGVKNSQQTHSDREKELESRLIQLTDHLIHKQAQVESLSTEKATLIFRLETLASQEKSRKPESFDVEHGTSTPELEFDFVNWYSEMSGKLDNLFIQGSRVLGMNRLARALVAAYLALLHGWVLFVVLRSL